VDFRFGVFASGFNEQNGFGWIFRKAIGQYTSGRAGTDDNVVVGHLEFENVSI
jgi:hypothetical protein